MRRISEITPPRRAHLGTLTWHQMEVTAIDDTTIELFSNDELAETFGCPRAGPSRSCASRRTSHRLPPLIAAAIGGYLDGENTLADEL